MRRVGRRFQVKKLPTRANQIELKKGTKVWHLPEWGSLSHPERLGVIRQIALTRARDPRMANLAAAIIKKAYRTHKVKPREYARQAAALLRWVQDPSNVYYLNEAGERLQDPVVTADIGYGDCDDQVILLATLLEAVQIPWRLVLSGRRQLPNGKDEKVRYIEGSEVPGNVTWRHIYLLVGDRPGSPQRWYFAETTVDGVPLGWDVVSGDHRFLPEMGHLKPTGKPPQIMPSPRAPRGHRPKPLPPRRNRSPAYAEAYAGAEIARPNTVGSSIGSAVAGEVEGSTSLDWGKIAGAVATGVAVSVLTQLTLDWVRGKGIWEGSGSAVRKLAEVRAKAHDIGLQHSAFVLPSPVGEGD